MAFSTRSQECFNKVLCHSLKTAASDIFSSSSLLEAAANDEDLAKVKMSRIMLTIAGIDFRITFLLHYRDDELIRSVIKSAANEEGGVNNIIDDSEELDAYFLEMGNRFCGEAKRLCYESFDHLGMSTPCVLSATTTLKDMHNADLQCEGHVRFEQAGAPVMAGSVFVYGKTDVELDLDDSQFAEQEGTGELEFF
ncbi:hypothetical protein [Marinagarivorans cellulosilyticus]|uniref:Uncharacterized protein n=1 Tax=Marinagarivorans cellulosilyticus TaxID=2721545 RepID=A0AAN2BL05_9GAMM|nr:hypothetical protein [Marinagarivorans cellulosilyticus]BCD98566.1 hypothetical protein MARGE09_P2767 [Marinagarivorans cellulosilyticus]